MSSGSITISYTTLAEIAVAAAVIGGVALIGSKQISSSSSSSAPVPAHAGSSSSSKATLAAANKKKRNNASAKATGEHVATQVQHAVHAVQETVQDSVDKVKDSVPVDAAVKKVQEVAVTATAAVTGAGTATATATGKNKKKNKNKGGNKTPPSPPAEAAPRSQEKKHDDMRDYELEPRESPARVIKIVGGDIGADPASVRKANAGEDGWEKAEAFEDDEGEWESVVSKKPSRPSTPSLSLNAGQPARSVPGLAPPQTKKQRENAARKAKEDALKREKDEEQERRLKAHRDALNRARAQEAALAKRPKPSSQNYFGSEVTQAAKPGVKGNLHAGLDPTSDGSLVWD